MSHLYVSVRLYGAVVDQQLVPVADVMRLGEGAGAVVAFPGADLLVQRIGRGVFVRGGRLHEGRPWAMSLGPVDVHLELVEDEPVQTDGSGMWRFLEKVAGGPLPMPDLRLLVATAAVAVGGSFWDAMNGFVETNPVASQNVQAILQTFDTTEPRRSAGLDTPERLSPAEADAGSKARDLQHPPARFEEGEWPPVGFAQ